MKVVKALRNSGFKEEFTYLEPKMPDNNNNKATSLGEGKLWIQTC